MRTNWTYQPWEQATSIEIGVLQAPSSLSLKAHVHRDVQIALVLHGWRTYETPLGCLVATPNDIVVIPADVPHASHGSSASAVTHLYVPRGHPAVCHLHMPQVIKGSLAQSPIELLDAVGSMNHYEPLRDAPACSAALLADVLDQHLSVRALAARIGLSTDGFIRAFRRQVGLTPAAYRNAHRLARARLNLKRGTTVVDAAFAEAFADQSHLGRHFQRAYGTTPSAYRSSFTAT